MLSKTGLIVDQITSTINTWLITRDKLVCKAWVFQYVLETMPKVSPSIIKG
jgi:hypothetical protein